MRKPVFDPGAKKRTVSLTLNADLYVKAKAEGIDASQVAEEALAQALKARLLEKARASPAEMLREYLAKRDADRSWASEKSDDHPAANLAFTRTPATVRSRGHSVHMRPAASAFARIVLTPIR